MLFVFYDGSGQYQLRRPTPSFSGTTTSVCSNTGFTSIGSTHPPPTSKAQIEVDISWDSFISHPAEGDWQKIAPLRILSFDIECQGRKGIFPEAERDSVIQIANMVVSQGEKDPFIRNVFTLNSCAPIVGSDVISFGPKEEARMLRVRSTATVQ